MIYDPEYRSKVRGLLLHGIDCLLIALEANKEADHFAVDDALGHTADCLFELEEMDCQIDHPSIRNIKTYAELAVEHNSTIRLNTLTLLRRQFE